MNLLQLLTSWIVAYMIQTFRFFQLVSLINLTHNQYITISFTFSFWYIWILGIFEFPTVADFLNCGIRVIQTFRFFRLVSLINLTHNQYMSLSFKFSFWYIWVLGIFWISYSGWLLQLCGVSVIRAFTFFQLVSLINLTYNQYTVFPSHSHFDIFWFILGIFWTFLQLLTSWIWHIWSKLLGSSTLLACDVVLQITIHKPVA